MSKTRVFTLTATAVVLLAACATGPTTGPTSGPTTGPTSGSTSGPTTGPMSFFVTSVGTGKGGDLGGLSGADAHCQRLAAAAGAGGKTWRAYLSAPGTIAQGSTPAVQGTHARDRIGAGPWYNAKGTLIARDITALHNNANITKDTALDEKGNTVKGRSDQPNEHDILTGSRADGTAFAPQTDTTCKAWTSSSDGSAIVGHHDRSGPLQDNWSTSWNFSHQTAGCSQEALVRTGGAGKLYCFATSN